jgi:hypothetical protein
MSAVLTGNAVFRLKCGRKSGLTSGMSCDVNAVEGKCNPPESARRLKGSKLWEAMARRPESKGFLGKAGFEKREPSRKVGFFLFTEKKGSVRGFMKFFPNTPLTF